MQAGRFSPIIRIDIRLLKHMSCLAHNHSHQWRW